MKTVGWLVMVVSTCLACVGRCSGPATPPDPPWLDSRSPDAARCNPAEPLFQLVGGPEYVGVIIPDSYFAELGSREEAFARWLGVGAQGAWTPTTADIERAEAGIRKALSAGVQDPELLDPYSHGNSSRADLIKKVVVNIMRDLPKYRRQYAGLVVDGRRHVLCRFFMPSEIFFRRWQCDYMSGNDFFDQLWTIQYDVGTKTYEGFDFGS